MKGREDAGGCAWNARQDSAVVGRDHDLRRESRLVEGGGLEIEDFAHRSGRRRGAEGSQIVEYSLLWLTGS